PAGKDIKADCGPENRRSKNSRNRREERSSDQVSKNESPDRSQGAGQAHGKFGYPEDLVRGENQPVSQRGFLRAKMKVELRSEVVAAFDHLSWGFGIKGFVRIPDGRHA